MIAEARRHCTVRQVVEIVGAAAAVDLDDRINAALGFEQQSFCALPAQRQGLEQMQRSSR